MDDFQERHRAWLRQLDLLDRPWFILGGAPNPVIPDQFVRTHSRIDINNSGATAKRLGLPPADITIRRQGLPWAPYPDLETRGMLWISEENMLILRARILRKRKVRIGKLLRMRKGERDNLVEAVIGPEMRGIGTLGKPSNGVVAICYGLYFGIPEIVLGGVSLSSDGHSYDSLGRKRKQVDEDRFALETLSTDSRLATTEPDLAAKTGLRLWTPTDPLPRLPTETASGA